jgi:hypothetical protein
MFAKVTGTSYVRDMSTGVLINKDSTGLQDYKEKRRLAEVQKEEINKIKAEMLGIKSDVSDIKLLLKQLLEKG